MNQELKIIVEQMEQWSKQYNLEMTPDFKSLILESNKSNLDLDAIKHLHDSVYDYKGKKVSASIAYEYNLIGAKIVTVSKDRKCAYCGNVIYKGQKALTTSKQINGHGVRSWFHLPCGEKLINLAKKESNEQYSYKEPDWDDGCSSNGY